MGKAKDKNLIRDDPEFQEWWERYGDMNPNVDLQKLSKWSYRKLHYLNEKGEQDTIETRALYINLHRVRWRDDNKAWSYPEFREWWDRFKHLNEGIDPKKLSKCTSKRLNYTDNEGVHRSISVHGLFYRFGYVKKKKTKRTTPVKSLAWDNEKFRETFTEELNPCIDLTEISTQDSKTKLRYYDGSGEIQTTVPMSWFAKEKKAEKLKKQTDPKLICWNYPEFRDLFCPELNPGMDPKALKTYDTRPIRYITAAGNIDTVGISNLFHGEPGKIRLPVNYQTTRLPERARHDEKFKAYYLGDGTETDLSEITNASKRFDFMCPEGHRFKISVNTFFLNYNEPCPHCRGQRINPETTSAAALDPELELFLDDDCDLRYMSCRNRIRVKFKCPFCKYRFTKALVNIVGKHPKCPMCKDTGYALNNVPTNNMETDIPYLSKG